MKKHLLNELNNIYHTAKKFDIMVNGNKEPYIKYVGGGRVGGAEGFCGSHEIF